MPHALPNAERRLSRRARIHVAAEVWLVNVLGFTVVCSAYLHGIDPTSARGWLFVHAGLLSCAATLSVLPGALSIALAVVITRRLVLVLVSGLVWSLALLAAYVDTRIWSIFRYHFNGLVWNVLTTPGADEAVQVGRSDLWTLMLLGLAFLAGELLVQRWLWGHGSRSRRSPLAARPTVVWSAVLVPCMLLVAGVYAWADLERDPHVMAYARVYPLYPRVTVKRFATRYFGFEPAEREDVDIPDRGILLDYPRVAPRLPADGPTPNIVVVVVDSLRIDMLTPEVMPRTHALSRRARVFRDHLSTGNATRFGLFGLLYGLHGSYWKAVYDEHRSPVLVDALLERGYEFRVLTSASMDFPEFRSTAWVRLEECVEDRIPFERPRARDDGVARRFEEWLGARSAPAQPLFAFLLLDAPHQSYWFPPDEAPFQPCLDEVAYSELADGATEAEREALFNRYRNAVRYDDGIVGRVLEALEAAGVADDTLVIVTGDHGEEFFENGFWGHTSNFTRAQIHVPFVLAGPGIPVGEETRPTSHLDVPATLLELCGADPGLREEWTLGASLLDPPSTRARVAAGWETLGLCVPGAILEVPLASHHGAGIAVYDERWQRVFEERETLRREGARLGALALECRRFLR